LVHDSVYDAFSKKLIEKIGKLHQGPSSDDSAEIGPITYEKQKAIYDEQLKEAKSKGAKFLTGGSFSKGRRFLRPTVVAGDQIESLKVYREETFGPVVSMTRFKSLAEAVQKA